jgi:hypothetical protein
MTSIRVFTQAGNFLFEGVHEYRAVVSNMLSFKYAAKDVGGRVLDKAAIALFSLDTVYGFTVVNE